MSITKSRIKEFIIERVDEKSISLEVVFPYQLSPVRHILIMTDGEFDLLIETIIAFTDNEPEREIHFVEAA